MCFHFIFLFYSLFFSSLFLQWTSTLCSFANEGKYGMFNISTLRYYLPRLHYPRTSYILYLWITIKKNALLHSFKYRCDNKNLVFFALLNLILSVLREIIFILSKQLFLEKLLFLLSQDSERNILKHCTLIKISTLLLPCYKGHKMDY